jgi:hypothetical protein
MASVEDDELCLCTKCVGKQFGDWIRKNGHEGTCDFDRSHGGSDPVVSVQALAEEVDRHFRDNYQKGEEYAYATEHSDNPSYDTHGEPYEDILANDLDCDENVFNAVMKALPDCDHADIASGDEPFYDDCANYESIADAEKRDRADQEEYWYENRFSYQWSDFCNSVQYERRFFKIKEPLDKLFGKPEEYDQGGVRPVYSLKAGQIIYHARLLDDEFTERRFDENPVGEIERTSKGQGTSRPNER